MSTTAASTGGDRRPAGRTDPPLAGSAGPKGVEGLAVAATVIAALAVLVLLGGGDLAGPSDWSIGGLHEWVGGRDPVLVAMAVLRLGALGAAGQILVVGVAGAIGSAAHLPGLVRAADLVAVPGLRGLSRRIAGIGLSASALVAPTTGHLRTAEAPVVITRLARTPPVIARRLPDPGSRSTDGPAPTTVTMVQLGPEDLEEGSSIITSGDPHGATMEQVDSGSTDTDPTWTVRPGDHLWSIARSTLEQRWSRPASDAEVARYWRKVLHANADLADPDLIFPGQAIALPAVD